MVISTIRSTGSGCQERRKADLIVQVIFPVEAIPWLEELGYSSKYRYPSQHMSDDLWVRFDNWAKAKLYVWAWNNGCRVEDLR